MKTKTDRAPAKPTPMRDIPIGSVVFTLTIFNEYDEVRETYYTKVSETVYHHHGCIQGSQQPFEEGERPRYFSPHLSLTKGYEYPMIPTLPVFPISESRFINFLVK